MSYRKANIRKSCRSIDEMVSLIKGEVLKLVYEDNVGAIANIGLYMKKIKRETHKIKRTTWRGDK